MIPPSTNHCWSRGHLDPWWQDYQILDYHNEQFNDSTALEFWRHLGYDQKTFTGDLYDMRRPEPKWIDKFRSIFPWQHFSWAVYRMLPGRLLPNHRDTYAYFKNKYDIQQPDKIYRAVILLEAWQSGHYLEIDGCPIVDWSAGDWVAWRYDTPHVAANIGVAPRYTLQITGVCDVDPLIQ